MPMNDHVTECRRMLHLTRASFFLFFTLAAISEAARGEDWPQWRGANRDGVWRETGIVQKFASDQLTPKWRVPLGSGYCGPTVAHGRVYVMDRITRPVESERVHCF